MSRRTREHVPTRPTWRCRACGIAWPCSPAKLRLLGEYRHDRAALTVHLATLQVEAAAQLVALDPGVSPAQLADRFVSWARPRG
ncbi:flavin reductase [Micromonospora sp. NPDC049060]|uniref:flavin reductase n=1 Tax=unclassified Micromonospora TaxID=2617518 RepID=UPI00124B3D73|nr:MULTISPECIES: flavin reductase [unclassified Micromonospora]KAB1128514.1 flavin reductase [Micromonospora sp. AMSO12t]WSG03236.1 flavin reductase [Micromonospora sp. NBC_01740]